MFLTEWWNAPRRQIKNDISLWCNWYTLPRACMHECMHDTKHNSMFYFTMVWNYFPFWIFINAHARFDYFNDTYTYIFWNLFIEKIGRVLYLCVRVCLFSSLAMQGLYTISVLLKRMPVHFVKINDRIKCKLPKIQNKLCLFRALNSSIIRIFNVSINRLFFTCILAERV